MNLIIMRNLILLTINNYNSKKTTAVSFASCTNFAKAYILFLILI
jgi:hypothetical protein